MLSMLHHQNPEDVQELILDNIKIQKIDDTVRTKLEQYTNLSILSLNNCGINSLESFPQLPSLRKV